jgi:hypothetical protein
MLGLLRILSRAYGSVTNNNGFWVRWLDLLTPSSTTTLNRNKFIITHNTPSAQFWSDLFWSEPRVTWTTTVFSSSLSPNVFSWILSSTETNWVQSYFTNESLLKSKSESHCDWRPVSQSVSLSVEPHLGLMTRYLLLFDSYVQVFCRAPSLTRGRVCLLYMLLAFASAVFIGSESLGTRDHILLSRIWDFPFRRLLRLAGSRWRY